MARSYDTAAVDQNVTLGADAFISQNPNAASRITRSRKPQPVVVQSEPTWNDRFKKALSAMSQALEGDQEYHKYLGM
jgi:hypothetical protein